MKKLVLSLGITFTTASFGQTWVASTGNDTNTCGRTNPCRTFQRAHDVTSAW